MYTQVSRVLLTACTVFVIVVSAHATGASGAKKKAADVLRNHLQEITKIVNINEKPCDDFPKFTCGYYSNVTAFEYPNERVHFLDIMKDIATNKNIRLEAAIKARDFYSSCLQFKKPADILKKVDMFKRTNFDLAKSLGELKTAGIDFIVKTNINVVDESRYKVVMGLQPDVFASDKYDGEALQKGLEALAVPSKDRSAAIESLNDFIAKGKEILSASVTSVHPVVTDTKDIRNFNWEAYLGEIKKLPKLANRKQEVEIEDSEVLQMVFDLMAGMDKKVLKYLTAFEVMRGLSDADCEITVEYFKLPILAEFKNLYFKDIDKDYNLKVFREFFKSYEKLKAKNLAALDGVYTRALEKKKILEDIEEILGAKKVNNAYKDVKIEKENFYQNFIGVLQWKLFKYLSKDSLKDDFSNHYLMNLLNPVNRDKPMFYHFATQSLYLWELFFRENLPKYSNKDLHDCIEKQVKQYKLAAFEEFDYDDYVTHYAAIQQAFLDFRNAWNEDFKDDRKLNEIFKEFKLTAEQGFFLNVAQRECVRINQGKNIAIRVFLNSNEVTEAFQCPAASLLNPPEKCQIGL